MKKIMYAVLSLLSLLCTGCLSYPVPKNSGAESVLVVKSEFINESEYAEPVGFMRFSTISHGEKYEFEIQCDRDYTYIKDVPPGVYSIWENHFVFKDGYKTNKFNDATIHTDIKADSLTLFPVKIVYKQTNYDAYNRAGYVGYNINFVRLNKREVREFYDNMMTQDAGLSWKNVYVGNKLYTAE